MDIGMIGLGKMGGNMAQRLLKAGHHVIGFDPSESTRKALAEKGAGEASSLADLVKQLKAPRAVWMMVPAGKVTEDTCNQLLDLLEAGDTVIDGGNSYYKDTVRRAEAADRKSIHYVDSGTSGGIWGITEGYSMMVGGDTQAVRALNPIFETLAPGKEKGWGRVGPVGSGHYTKMVHNGIEYGLMQAYAEGFSVLQHKKEFNLDLHQVAEIWQYGSVVRSWLLDLIVDALGKNPTLHGIAPYVEDSGEGRWTLSEAIDMDISAPVIASALFERLRSREQDSFIDKMLSAMRNEFGGHAMKKG